MPACCCGAKVNMRGASAGGCPVVGATPNVGAGAPKTGGAVGANAGADAVGAGKPKFGAGVCVG